MGAIKALHHIWHNGKKFTPGQVIQELDKETAERLVKSDAALFVGQQTLLVDDNQLPNDPGGEGEPEDPRQVINDNFTLKELTSEAKAIGLEFPSSIQKPDFIDLILKEGKTDHFLDMLEDEED